MTEGEQHQHTREESGEYIRFVCSCGHRGRWRFTHGVTVERLLASDDNAHLFAVRRQNA